jgi:hypothetical protein
MVKLSAEWSKIPNLTIISQKNTELELQVAES